jgi:hypothetical protein
VSSEIAVPSRAAAAATARVRTGRLVCQAQVRAVGSLGGRRATDETDGRNVTDVMDLTDEKGEEPAGAVAGAATRQQVAPGAASA